MFAKLIKSLTNKKTIKEEIVELLKNQNSHVIFPFTSNIVFKEALNLAKYVKQPGISDNYNKITSWPAQNHKDSIKSFFSGTFTEKENLIINQITDFIIEIGTKLFNTHETNSKAS
jgi:hypothetical protein